MIFPFFPGATEMEAQYESRLFMQQTLAESPQIAVGRGDRGNGTGQPGSQHDSGESHGGKSFYNFGLCPNYASAEIVFHSQLSEPDF